MVLPTSPSPKNIAKTLIRPLQYRDLEAIIALIPALSDDRDSGLLAFHENVQQLQQWYAPLKFLSCLPSPWQRTIGIYVAEQDQKLQGLIKVSPFNRSWSTWRVEQVLVAPGADSSEIGSALLRHCFETLLEARTWVLEVNIHNQQSLSLYRLNGFQPLASMTYWAIAPEIIKNLADQSLGLPNLLPVSNADAHLLYQLDTVSMPPLLRQVFDRHPQDFKTGLLRSLLRNLKHWLNHTEAVSGYVFEPQRKAAIGYFYLRLSHNSATTHSAKLTVHPAYTWLYPELLVQMAKVVQEFPAQSLELASADYQPEREEYLTNLGATRIEHTLLMSRSVWHKLREAKSASLEVLQLSDMLQSLQPGQTPVPNRITWFKQQLQSSPTSKLVNRVVEKDRSTNPPLSEGERN